ncbi:hypothetical protein AWB73_02151 [Caballeronia turbans]|uniref:hypothetical protein n=1 Tax=Caballeronia sp. INML2 TaxID=2921748 RepID=UPI00074BD166|nr:hypothetical protein [Caballeronia sp. INML2]SAL27678.1 hypothetical protein AWB73_02151 [Caballeronia turbans]
MLYLPSEDWHARVDLWNFLCKDNFNNWRAWSQWKVLSLQAAGDVIEAHLAVFRGVLQKLEMAHEHIALSRYALKDVPSILDEWMENQKVRYHYGYRGRKIMPDLCLMLACQLNEDGAFPVSEVAVGILFGSWQMLGDTKPSPRRACSAPFPRPPTKSPLPSRLYRPPSRCSGL